jgi:hypothetical protein
MGETVMSAIARSRDRCTAIGYCVRTNVVYRAQNSSWTTKDFDDVDTKFLSLVKKATLNMNSFPSRLLVSDRKHGGLGIISISQAAHERKRKVLLELVNRKGAEGVASQGIIVNALRAAGQGGLRSATLWESLNGEGSLDSLINLLKGIGLRLRVGLGDRHERSAAEAEEDVEGRIALNGRGINLRSELSGSTETVLRIGQCWRVGCRNLEILAFRGDLVEYMEWGAFICLPRKKL